MGEDIAREGEGRKAVCEEIAERMECTVEG